MFRFGVILPGEAMGKQGHHMGPAIEIMDHDWTYVSSLLPGNTSNSGGAATSEATTSRHLSLSGHLVYQAGWVI